ncbi:hypothetical protein ACFQAS_14320 [Halopenitus salinus]|uniref:PIN domain-containing protein n=1 Tax=Halopenitus salinus TaxID=1198295 RepID=A0ABD5UPG6_9EURY
MAESRRAGDERVNVFVVDDVHLFKHFFEDEAVFDRLKRYYNNHQYRFEVPANEYDELREFLEDHGYGLVGVDVIEEFVVVVKKYTDHPDNIFKESVVQRTVNGYNCFLMTDQSAVENAVQQGAIRLRQTDLANPF